MLDMTVSPPGLLTSTMSLPFKLILPDDTEEHYASVVLSVKSRCLHTLQDIYKIRLYPCFVIDKNKQ